MSSMTATRVMRPVGWILSFGRGVKVVRPAELSGRVREEALALARQ